MNPLELNQHIKYSRKKVQVKTESHRLVAVLHFVERIYIMCWLNSSGFIYIRIKRVCFVVCWLVRTLNPCVAIPIVRFEIGLLSCFSSFTCTI